MYSFSLHLCFSVLSISRHVILVTKFVQSHQNANLTKMGKTSCRQSITEKHYMTLPTLDYNGHVSLIKCQRLNQFINHVSGMNNQACLVYLVPSSSTKRTTALALGFALSWSMILSNSSWFADRLKQSRKKISKLFCLTILCSNLTWFLTKLPHKCHVSWPFPQTRLCPSHRIPPRQPRYLHTSSPSSWLSQPWLGPGSCLEEQLSKSTQTCNVKKRSIFSKLHLIVFFEKSPSECQARHKTASKGLLNLSFSVYQL